ncbi:hypothetical protein PR202_ga09332 [Eleusine coracana subsp. coracana]|uniref:Cysteine proteinase inhibitor n=1 Tax=Eleusine coracana subsp. coracana TaxID=191504 RepID=A0AAV5C4S6_ELECO|nr:hypothetical protein PR202_ga09332 [Eleusine coracana subsp. coracana]
MRKYRLIGLVALLVLLALVVLSTRSAETDLEEKAAMADGGPVVGGIKDSPAGTDNDLHVIDLARFAVEEHNKKAVSPHLFPLAPLCDLQGPIGSAFWSLTV